MLVAVRLAALLSLDDPRWRELDHAFGSAADIPALLERLAAAPLPQRWQEEPLSSLVKSLCHQRSTYGASYAATPHLVETAARAAPHERGEVLGLVGSIAAYDDSGDPVPDWLADDYESSLARAAGLAMESASAAEGWRAVLLRIADLAATSRHRGLAQVLMALESGEADVTCAACELRFTIGCGEDGVEVEPAEWLERTAIPEPASPLDLSTTSLNDPLPFASLAENIGQTGAARVLADLGSWFRCLGCGERLLIRDSVARAL